MPWDRERAAAAKYRTPEHRAQRKRYTKQMQAQGYLTCAQPVCIKPSRIIQPGETWHVLHDDSGSQYIGPGHKACNEHDAGVRGRARQAGTGKPSGWGL